MSDLPGNLYLNLDNRWPTFRLSGLALRPDGSLTLAQVPANPQPAGPEMDASGGLAGPAGIGVDEEGNLYVSEPARHRVIRIDACDGQGAPLPCLSGPGTALGQFDEPRGVLVGPRQTLYIADSGNHRVQLFDLHTLQLRGVWGQPDPWAPPEGSDAPGRFQHPWDLAADSTGHVYVADSGVLEAGGWRQGRVQKFDPDGCVDLSFCHKMDQDPPGRPTAVAVGLPALGESADERLLVLDGQPPRLLVYRLDGTLDAEATDSWQRALGQAGTPAALATGKGMLYVGDVERQRVLVFRWSGEFVGIARGYRGPVAALAVDRSGRFLLVHPGGGAALQRLDLEAARLACGSFMAGPFEVESRATHWHRLQIIADPLPPGAGLQLFTCTSQPPDGSSPPVDPPPPPACDASSPWRAAPASAELTPHGVWRPASPNALDTLVLNQPGRHLWIAGLLEGDGTVSPVLHQMRLDYEHPSWLRYLPAIYSREENGAGFLARLLALFESILEHEESLIADLPRLFDPEAATGPWLDWLAGWLALEPAAAWTEAQLRQVLSHAFELLGRRGTVEGLRRLIEVYTGVTVRISEPGQFARPWLLGEPAMLGVGTMLPASDPQGAVLDTTATLGASHLGADQEYGADLFGDLANRFCVEVYAADLTGADMIEQIRLLLDREKPAHTTYQLYVIEPKMRVGVQARVGIDAIVAGRAGRAGLDNLRLDIDSYLAVDEDCAQPGRVGSAARLGLDTRLA